MNKLTEKIFEKAPYGCFTNQDVVTLFPGSEDKRHGLVKRAIAGDEIIHVRRGLYCLASKYQKRNINLYLLAQHIYGPSYISLESALSYYGWIPEAVYTMASVSCGQSKEFETPLGMFSYSRVPQKVFYAGVERLVDQAGDVFLMARPLKAMADYVYLHKKNWIGLKAASESLRIEPEEFESVTAEDFDMLIENYKSRRVQRFLNGVMKELKL